MRSAGLLSKARWWLLPLLLSSAAFAGACGMMGDHRMMAPVEPRPSVTAVATATPGGSATVSFRADVLPLLTGNCVQCHGGQMGLYVDTYETLLAGSSRNKVIVPGQPERSLLVQRLKGEITPRMPLNGRPLDDKEIARIEAWIREGAPNN